MAFLGAISIMGFLISIIGIIYMAIRKKNKKPCCILSAICFCLIIFAVANTTPKNKSVQPSSANSTIKVEQKFQKTNKDQTTAYYEWIKNLKIPMKKYEENINKYTLILANAQSGKISKSQIVSAMKELEINFQNEVNFGFRNITPPSKNLFTEEQNQKIWYIQAYFADAANNYSSAAYYTGTGIKNNNTDQVKLSEESILKANSYIEKAISNLKSLQQELGIIPDQLNDIKINLN